LRKFINIKGESLDIVGVVSINFILDKFNKVFEAKLFVLKESLFVCDIIFGRDFIEKGNFVISCNNPDAGLDYKNENTNLQLTFVC